MIDQNKKTKQRISQCKWKETLPPGTLVRPTKLTFLTPIQDDESADWPEWSVGEIALVLPSFENQLGLLVLAPRGVGFCFADEVKQI
jgi:hypothetical protein